MPQVKRCHGGKHTRQTAVLGRVCTSPNRSPRNDSILLNLRSVCYHSCHILQNCGSHRTQTPRRSHSTRSDCRRHSHTLHIMSSHRQHRWRHSIRFHSTCHCSCHRPWHLPSSSHTASACTILQHAPIRCLIAVFKGERRGKRPLGHHATGTARLPRRLVQCGCNSPRSLNTSRRSASRGWDRYPAVPLAVSQPFLSRFWA